MKFLHHVLHELDKNGTFVIAVLCVLFFLYLPGLRLAMTRAIFSGGRQLTNKSF